MRLTDKLAGRACVRRGGFASGRATGDGQTQSVTGRLLVARQDREVEEPANSLRFQERGASLVQSVGSRGCVRCVMSPLYPVENKQASATIYSHIRLRILIATVTELGRIAHPATPSAEPPNSSGISAFSFCNHLRSARLAFKVQPRVVDPQKSQRNLATNEDPPPVVSKSRNLQASR
jgi:hypothetical protein